MRLPVFVGLFVQEMRERGDFLMEKVVFLSERVGVWMVTPLWMVHVVDGRVAGDV